MTYDLFSIVAFVYRCASEHSRASVLRVLRYPLHRNDLEKPLRVRNL